ncbi:MAG: hypothetical protein MZV64_63195 [Ignavibacteriales bacterium]|nr:hypothetical protein [Ignavibacteriales bacterium]
MFGVLVTTIGMLVNVLPPLLFADISLKVSLLRVGSVQVLPIAGIFLIVSIASMALGEMFASPRIYEYIGAIAPKGQEGLYLGYANLPIALASIDRRPDRRPAVRALHQHAAQGGPAGRHRDDVAHHRGHRRRVDRRAVRSTTGWSSRADEGLRRDGPYFLAFVGRAVVARLVRRRSLRAISELGADVQNGSGSISFLQQRGRACLSRHGISLPRTAQV